MAFASITSKVLGITKRNVMVDITIILHLDIQLPPLPPLETDATAADENNIEVTESASAMTATKITAAPAVNHAHAQ